MIIYEKPRLKHKTWTQQVSRGCSIALMSRWMSLSWSPELESQSHTFFQAANVVANDGRSHESRTHQQIQRKRFWVMIIHDYSSWNSLILRSLFNPGRLVPSTHPHERLLQSFSGHNSRGGGANVMPPAWQKGICQVALKKRNNSQNIPTSANFLIIVAPKVL